MSFLLNCVLLNPRSTLMLFKALIYSFLCGKKFGSYRPKRILVVPGWHCLGFHVFTVLPYADYRSHVDMYLATCSLNEHAPLLA